MEVGLRLIDDAGSARSLVSLAVLADELGFESVWYPHDSFRLNSWPLLGATAVQTSRVRLGMRTNLFTCDLSEIASAAVTLDLLSSGRAMVGLGTHTTRMLSWIGRQASEVIERSRDSVIVLEKLLRGERVADVSPFFPWTDEAFLRCEILRPDLPVYMAPFGAEYMRMSGSVGAGSLPMVTPPSSAGDVVRLVREGAEAAGKTDPEIVGFLWISVADDRDAALNCVDDVVAYFGVYLDDFALAHVGLCQEDFAEIRAALDRGDREEARRLVTPPMRGLAVAGTVEDCIEQLEGVAAAGVTHASLGGPLGPDPGKAVRLIGEKILPVLARQ